MRKLVLKFKIPFIIICAFLFIIFSSSTFAQTQEECVENLNKAEKELTDGNFESANGLIQPCLKILNISEKIRGYRLLGLVAIAQQLAKEANEAVKNLLLLSPNYMSNPEIDPPPFKKIVDDMSQTLIPIITSITPSSVDKEGNNFMMTVFGTDFVYGSAVRFNGIKKVTTYVSAAELRAEIPSDDILEVGDFNIEVYSPIRGGINSDPVKFQVVSKSSFPWTWVAAGGGAVAAAVVAILLLNGDDDDVKPRIAEPPTRP